MSWIIQGDSLARSPTKVYLQIFNEFVNQLTDNELTTGYYQQDGVTCHTSNASMREIKSFFKEGIISKNLWPPRSPDLTLGDFFLWAYWRSKCTKIHLAQSNNSKTLYVNIFKPSTSTLWEKYSRIWRNAFKCAWMWKETSFSIDYEQVLFRIVPGMRI